MERFTVTEGAIARIKTARREYIGFVTYVSPSARVLDIYCPLCDGGGLWTIAASNTVSEVVAR